MTGEELIPCIVATSPSRISVPGTCVLIEPLDPQTHGDSLWYRIGGTTNQDLWRYMHTGPFPDRASFDTYLNRLVATDDPLYFAVVNRETGLAEGHASYMRIDAGQRVIEVGAILYSAELQRTRAATEAMYLMARHVFEDLGFRRYEWKCNAKNDASQNAARRLGFAFEGVFRQHMIVKGRNRDTAWFSMLDSEWPARKQEFERWLNPSNFDGTGRQKTRLSHS